MSKWDKYRQASERGMEFLLSQMDTNGGFTDPVANSDIASIYKLPNQLAFSGRAIEAAKSFDFIKTKYLQSNGDFLSYSKQTGIPMCMNVWVPFG